MSEEESSGSQTNKGAWRSRLSSHSGTLLVVGIIMMGFLIALLYGGFPSILLPVFLLLAIGVPVALVNTVRKSASKKESKPVKPAHAFCFLLVFFLLITWFASGLLPVFQGPVLNRIFRKVEFPFSEASHVVADSEGSVYVYSQFNKRIQKYSEDGKFQFGWFAANWKNSEIAMDANDHVYSYYNWVVREYDSGGNLIDEISREAEGSGWWRLEPSAVTWDPNAEKPRRYDLYDEKPKQYGDVHNTIVKEGDLMPAFELRESGFKTEYGTYYTLRRLWFLFPVVSVEGGLGKVEDYVMPNPLSLAFTFVFPGFFFYVLALIITWVFQKQSERLTRRCLVYILGTAAIFIVGAAAVVIGGSIVMVIANSLPKSNPLRFWLVPLVVIPYWIIVVWTAFLVWGRLRRWFRNAPHGENKDA
ncbi:MAG: NHL repeat-containing protein [Planctomycetota bacterium]|jgi:hypothetical protein